MSSQPNSLVGIWKLVSASAIHSDGTIDTEIYGSNPTGYITYTVEGRVMVIFSRSDRLPFSKPVQSPLSDEMRSIPIQELAQAFMTFNAYAGTYTIDGNTVTHHLEIASIPNRIGTALIRTFTIASNQITLRTPSNDFQTAFELIWERIMS